MRYSGLGSVQKTAKRARQRLLLSDTGKVRHCRRSHALPLGVLAVALSACATSSPPPGPADLSGGPIGGGGGGLFGHDLYGAGGDGLGGGGDQGGGHDQRGTADLAGATDLRA
jgi:hypothetical protein